MSEIESAPSPSPSPSPSSSPSPSPSPSHGLRRLWSEHRALSWTLVGVLGVAAIAGPVVALATSGSDGSAETLPTPSAEPEKAPRSTASPSPRPTPSPTPTRPADIVLEAERWWPFGTALIDRGAQREFTTATGPVSFYFPGLGEREYSAAQLLPGEEIVRERYTVAGSVEDPLVVLVVSLRVPGQGLDPAQYVVDLVSIDPATDEIAARTTVHTRPDDADVVRQVVGSDGDAVAIALLDGSGELATVTGYDARTGSQRWQAQGLSMAPAFGSVTIRTAVPDGDSTWQECVTYTGLDITSGATVWSVAAADHVDEDGCAEVEIVADSSWGSVNEGEAMFGRLAAVEVEDRDYNPVVTRVFDLLSGEELVRPAGRFELYDPVTRYVYSDTSPGMWVGDRYSEPVRVVDLVSGGVVFELDAERANALEFEAVTLYGGYLYAITADGTPVIDVATGDVVVEHAPAVPVGAVGPWTLYDDGVLSLDTDRL